MLQRVQYLPCIPTRGTEVPAGPDWFHEIKHDGYRLIVQREGKRVRLLTRRGYDWSDRYPLITQAALHEPGPPTLAGFSLPTNGTAEGRKHRFH
jgi:ATP-dependent DNA ligase